MPSRMRLRPTGTPNRPRSGTVLFVDQADDILKGIDETGTVTAVGSGDSGLPDPTTGDVGDVLAIAEGPPQAWEAGPPPSGVPTMVHGPFRMNFDTADITTNGALVPGLGALGATSIILGVYIRVVTGWGAGIGATVIFYTSDAEVSDAGPTMVEYLLDASDDGAPGALQRPNKASVLANPTGAVDVVPAGAAIQPALTTADLQYIVAFVTEETPPATAGAMDVYVVTATFVA